MMSPTGRFVSQEEGLDRERDAVENAGAKERIFSAGPAEQSGPGLRLRPYEGLPVIGPLVRYAKWVAGGNVRLSIAAGVLAGVVVGLGFLAFDLRKDEWMLRQEFPGALSSSERILLSARGMMDRGEYGRAESTLRNLLKKKKTMGTRGEALLLLGDCLQETARNPLRANEAREVWGAFIEEYPTDFRVPSTHLKIANSYSKSGLYGDAAARLEKLLSTAPDTRTRGRIEFLIGQNQFRAHNYETAADILRRVQQEHAGTSVALDSMVVLGKTYYESEKPEESKRVLAGVADEAPGSPQCAVALQLLAKHAYENGRYGEAAEHCIRWLNNSPLVQHQPDIMYTLASSKLQAGLPGEALAVATDVPMFFPFSERITDALVLRGKALEALGEMAEAEGAYREAASVSPEASEPYEGLSRVYLAMGRAREAVEQMEHACSIAPDKDSLIVTLAELYRLNNDSESALALLRAFTQERQLSPNIGEAFMMLADLQLESGHPDIAYKTLEELFALVTTTVEEAKILRKQADILARVGLHEDAMEAYGRAVEAGEAAEAVSPSIAASLLAVGKPRECLYELEKVDDFSFSLSERFDLFELKARAYLKLGAYREAQGSIEKAIALRSGREKFSTLALLMQANLALEDYRNASRIFELTLRLMDSAETEAPADARRNILDWAWLLYQQGEYSLAAKAYSTVTAPAFPATDAAWALYQKGNCYYRLGKYEMADEVYDNLAGTFADSEWVELAAQRKELIVLKNGS